MTAAALTLLWSIARGALEISGSATCPTPAEVEAEIARRGGIPAASEQRAELDLDAEDPDHPRLRLRLFDAADKLLGERTLPADAHCQALAVTVATMLLSFELDLGEAPPTDVSPAPPASAPAPTPVHHSFAFEAGLGAFFSSTFTGAGDRAGAGLLLASLGIDGSPVQPELAAEVESPRVISVGGKLANWERLWVAPGVRYRFLRRPGIWASAHFDFPLGAALASGSGLGTNLSGSIFDFGVGAGMRLGLGTATLSRAAARRGGILPWAGLWIIYWPLRPELFLSDASSNARLPIIEGLAGVGLSWFSP